MVSKLWEIWTGLFIPDAGSRIRTLTFYPSRILNPGVKKAPDHGSRIRKRNTTYIARSSLKARLPNVLLKGNVQTGRPQQLSANTVPYMTKFILTTREPVVCSIGPDLDRKFEKKNRSVSGSYGIESTAWQKNHIRICSRPKNKNPPKINHE